MVKYNSQYHNMKTKKATICLNMIVKNEAHIICETLSNIKKYIDYWIICDTGSTDGTQDLIKEYFKKENIPGELHQHKWQNFGYNRTKALEACKGKSDYIWIIDADDIIVGDIQLPRKMTNDAYELAYDKNFRYYRTQIVKNNSNLKWEYLGILHEYINCKTKPNYAREKIGGDYYIDSRRLGSRNNDPLKYKRDAELLVKEIEKYPNNHLNARYSYYAAQSYYDYKDYPNAVKYYKKRIEYGGWYEEVFMSYYRIAQCLHIQYTNNSNNITQKEVIVAYLNAHKNLPSRCEPLYDLGILFYNNNEKDKAYFYLKLAAKIEYPRDQILLVAKYLYDYECKYRLAFVCEEMGKIDEAIKYINEIILDPSIPQYVHNYKNRLLEQSKNQMTTQSTNNSIKQFSLPIFDDYDLYVNKDSYGFDNGYYDKSIEELKVLADADNNCEGFNTWGFLKYDIVPSNKFIRLESNKYIQEGIYIKKNHRDKKRIHFEIMNNDTINEDEYMNEIKIIEQAEELAKDITNKVYIFGENLNTVQMHNHHVIHNNVIYCNYAMYDKFKSTFDL